MQNINRHTQSLFRYIYCLPDDIKEIYQPKYANGQLRLIQYEKEYGEQVSYYNPKWIENNTQDCTFCGLQFQDNRVFVINIYIFCKDKDYQPQYLEITEIFNKMLKQYNIFHLSLILSTLFRKKFYKESTLAHNLRTKILYDDQRRLPKFRYSIQKHHSRERKFYCDTESEGIKRWAVLIDKTLQQVSNLSSFRTSGKDGHHPGLWTDYHCVPRMVSGHHKARPSDGVREKKPRKLRRGYFSSYAERR